MGELTIVAFVSRRIHLSDTYNVWHDGCLLDAGGCRQCDSSAADSSYEKGQGERERGRRFVSVTRIA
jgi:hypothetical protein